MNAEHPELDECAMPPANAPADQCCPVRLASTVAKLQSGLATLTPVGANCFDPTRLLYIEALADRAARQPTRVAQALTEQALNLLGAYQASLTASRKQAGHTVSQCTHQDSNRPAETTGAAQASDKRANDGNRVDREANNGRRLAAIASLTQRLNAQPPASHIRDGAVSFAEQLRLQEQALTHARGPGSGTDSEESSADEKTARSTDPVAPAPRVKQFTTLKAARRSDDAISRMRTGLKLGKAIALCPPESGPLNPQALIVQSLQTMRELSPDYAHRLISQLDTLNWLEQLATQRQSKPTPVNKRR